MTYDPTAKAEAISRLVRAIRQEAVAIKTAFGTRLDATQINILWRHKAALEAQIELLEICEIEWREKARQWQNRFQGGEVKDAPENAPESRPEPQDRAFAEGGLGAIMEKVAADESAKEGGQGSAGAAGGPQKSPSQALLDSTAQRFGLGEKSPDAAGATICRPERPDSR